jgi:signal transduction histidine kinase
VGLPHDETSQELLDRLRREVADLRASRERVVLGADAERRSIERDLHDGMQQHLVALAVKLQLAGRLAETDPGAARALIEEMAGDVQQALDESARLAQRIYPPLLEPGGLAAALRVAVVNSGIPASVEVATGASYPLEIARTVYLCCLEALEHVGAGATVTVRDDEHAVVFEVAGESERITGAAPPSGVEFERLRDRVEALGGALTVRSEPGAGTSVSGSLTLAR